ncbi:MAG: hypothetical protein GPOALKHO_001279 [Sodalis sp.]|nr:MAG: hypothetical protein GPOALKHO_001279 [Sodalis sp.]
MLEIKLHDHVTLMRKIFEQQPLKDAAKDTFDNECDILNQNLNFSLFDDKNSKRPEKQTFSGKSGA